MTTRTQRILAAVGLVGASVFAASYANAMDPRTSPFSADRYDYNNIVPAKQAPAVRHVAKVDSKRSPFLDGARIDDKRSPYLDGASLEKSLLPSGGVMLASVDSKRSPYLDGARVDDKRSPYLDGARVNDKRNPFFDGARLEQNVQPFSGVMVAGRDQTGVSATPGEATA
ncbi:hypothetical protein ACKI2N_007930 [Cupriavidus sp. 30B13]|uniref:hypothetical protein n=1 Tax=Cupriavidus sp. 30B13 TaxID=3384241 RepID=UPI003B8F9FEB